MGREADAIVPVELLAQFAYCPRRAYLIRAQGEWEDNAFVEEGRGVHQRVVESQETQTQLPTRSVHLESLELGLRGVVDVLEREGRSARPVEYKRGAKPPGLENTRKPERVQLCAQALLLRERGYQVHEGVIYYAASRERVRVRITPQLEARTLEIAAQLKELLQQPVPPPPLEDSPKCPRCSLVGICLPEETNFLRRGGPVVRPLAVAEPLRFPLVVQQPGALVGLQGGSLVVREPGGAAETFGLETLSQLVLMGSVAMSTPALQACLERGIPVVYLSGTGWFYGYARGLSHRHAALRQLQYAAAAQGDTRQRISNTLVSNKIANSRTLLRRNGRAPQGVLDQLARLVKKAKSCCHLEELLSVEGCAARAYFQHFHTLLKHQAANHFSFEQRNRRPPTDPVNALLSFLYALLLKDWTIVLETVGFDPFLGFLHAPRHGKPALALDLMEPFRPLVAESVAITVLNNREITLGDFISREGSVLLTPQGRRRVFLAYQRRLAQTITHPIFGYEVTYRRLFEIHARLLARFLYGEIPDPPEFVVR